MDDKAVLRARNLNKRYLAVQALAEVNLDIQAGQVHALLGSNGAGKSTLVKILTGAITPDTGEVLLNGQRIPPGNPKAALEAGISCIYQESNLVPALSVLDNIMLGRQPTYGPGLLDRPAQRVFVRSLLARNGLLLDLDTPVQALPTGQQKEVEIAKALSLKARVILMDEPTAWLSQVEVETLFRAIRNLTREGVGVLYISHVLDEIFTIADRVTVLRDGKVHLAAPIGQINKGALVQAMLGRQLSAETDHLQHELPPSSAGPVALECRNLSKAGLFEAINLSVHRGEIVCITGLVGAKRSELVRTLFGAERADQGEVFIHGQAVTLRRPQDAIDRGLGFVPEDRRRDGLFMSLSVNHNLALASLNPLTRLGLVSGRLLNGLGQKQVARLGIVPPRLETPVRNLSGGNQQKVLVGRWLASGANIIILDEPTVGIDVGAKADIYQLLRHLAAEGAAILIVSSDMEEVMTIADRILVMAQGRLVGNFLKGQASQAEILRAAGGELAQ
ncbi:MAG: sugar ABC transporter ATP-binding protein [Anaerolineales bacterium]|nr:sugar ABC transporter ATP-binding protein [Anaerolineales bacterium]